MNPPGRLYRTGDQGYWSPRGLEFLGRRDHQVKLNGYRIELRGLEATARTLAEIEDAAAAVLPGPDGKTRLGMVVVPARGATPDAEDIRGLLADVLPEHARPSVVVVAPQLRLTPNGKVDLLLLQEASAAAYTPVADEWASQAPSRDPIEEAVVGAVRTVLRRDVTAEDNFFSLGGTSLEAMELAKLIRNGGVRCSVRDVYELQTVSRLVAELKERDAG